MPIIIGKVFYFYGMVLLSFNILSPEIPVGNRELVSEEELLKITYNGTKKIIDILEKHYVFCTFFVEVSLVEKMPDLLQLIVKKGHELGILNHHSAEEEIGEAKLKAEEITGKFISGIRQFPKFKLGSEVVKRMKFSYHSSMYFSNIFWLDKDFDKKTVYEEHELVIVPDSWSPYSKLPYNDFTFQMLPMFFYKNMVNNSMKGDDEYIVIYLNSWQFVELNHSKFGLPLYRKYNLGKQMERKLERFLMFLEESEWAVNRMKDFFF